MFVSQHILFIYLREFKSDIPIGKRKGESNDKEYAIRNIVNALEF